MVLKQRIYSAQWKYELPGSRKRCKWVEEIYRVLLDVPLCMTEDECSSRVQTEILII